MIIMYQYDDMITGNRCENYHCCEHDMFFNRLEFREGIIEYCRKGCCCIVDCLFEERQSLRLLT